MVFSKNFLRSKFRVCFISIDVASTQKMILNSFQHWKKSKIMAQSKQMTYVRLSIYRTSIIIVFAWENGIEK